MQLETRTWQEVEAYLAGSCGIIMPTGSTEQHGPVGLIGTDAICAREIARGAAERAGAMVAPALAYTPAPFNMAFPGTVSISEDLFVELAAQVIASLAHHGFAKIFILNGHGANLAPLRRAVQTIKDADVRIKSWWDYAPVNRLRADYYGDWEGMHATPSEVAITQATHRIIEQPDLAAPERLSAAYIKAHAGDKHGGPQAHRARFPDGRVGSHSGLARPEHGQALLQAACTAVAADYQEFLGPG
jgi:creatinine amidohydrolase